MATFAAPAVPAPDGRSTLPRALPGNVLSTLAAPVEAGSRETRAATAPGGLR